MIPLKLIQEFLPAEVCDHVPELEIELAEDDIACAEPADGQRLAVRVQFGQLNLFLSQYLKARRGEPLVVPAPEGGQPGDLVDVEIAIGDQEPLTLHAQLLGRWPAGDSQLVEVQLVAGRLTDRMVAPLIERAFGERHAEGLLRTCKKPRRPLH